MVGSMQCSKAIHNSIDRRLGVVFDCGLAIAKMMRSSDAPMVATALTSDRHDRNASVLIKQEQGSPTEITFLRKCGDNIAGIRVYYDASKQRMAFLESFDRNFAMARVELLSVNRPAMLEEARCLQYDDIDIIGESCRTVRRGKMRHYLGLNPDWREASRSGRISGLRLHGECRESANSEGKAIVAFLDDIIRKPDGIADDVWPEVVD